MTATTILLSLKYIPKKLSRYIYLRKNSNRKIIRSFFIKKICYVLKWISFSLIVCTKQVVI